MKYRFLTGEKVIKLSDDDYYYFLVNAIKKAKKKIYAVIFIVDPLKDPGSRIRKILDELSYARWRGLDVRLVVGHSDRTFVIDMCGRAAKKYCNSMNVPVKFSNPEDDSSLHSKYLVMDDNLVILGSHNWTNNDIFSSNEDSLALYSREVALDLSGEFYEIWESGLEVLS